MSAPRKWILIGTLLLGVTIASGILYFFAPDEHRFYPRCLLFSATGLQCPGCGGLRAAHALLHGNLTTAFHLNPFLILLLPVIAWFLIVITVRQLTARTLPNPFLHPWCGWTGLLLLLVFAVTRNL